MVSSIRENIWKVEKQKKINRRIAKLIQDDMDSSFISVDSFNNKNQKLEEEVTNAIEERQEPENNQSEHSQVEEKYPQKQAIAIALTTAGKSKPKTKNQKRKQKKPIKKRSGGVIKKFSEIAKPQKFKGIF